MNKTVSIIGIILLVAGIGYVVTRGPKPTEQNSDKPTQNIEIKNGVQYITINAGGGYSPRTSNAKAGIPTKLVMKTNGIFDCSAALSVRSVGFQKILPQTGETEIDLGSPKVGEPIRGICGMGMYSFTINFN